MSKNIPNPSIFGLPSKMERVESTRHMEIVLPLVMKAARISINSSSKKKKIFAHVRVPYKDTEYHVKDIRQGPVAIPIARHNLELVAMPYI